MKPATNATSRRARSRSVEIPGGGRVKGSRQNHGRRREVAGPIQGSPPTRPISTSSWRRRRIPARAPERYTAFVYASEGSLDDRGGGRAQTLGDRRAAA